MGNQPSVRIALKLDEPPTPAGHESGEVLQGRILLAVDRKAQLAAVQGIHLRLEGWEQTALPRRDAKSDGRPAAPRRQGRPCPAAASGSDRSGRDSLRLATSVHTLVRQDHAAVPASALRIGRHEYPFRWRLPAGLPSSLRCDGPGGGSAAGGCGEIRYVLTAYLAEEGPTNGARASSEPRSATVALRVAAGRPSSGDDAGGAAPRPVAVEPEVFPVRTCLLCDRGQIHLGWCASTNVAWPGDFVAVDIVGDNRSRAAVRYVAAKWVETVQWRSADASAPPAAVSRVLCERRLIVAGCGLWQPWLGPLSTGRREDAVPVDRGALQREALRAELLIPADARDSYEGPLISVRHTLVVKVKLEGWFMTTPESTYETRIVRKYAMVEVEEASNNSSSATTEVPAWQHTQVIPEAEIVYTESGPVVDDPVEIPMAQAVLIDEQLGRGLRRSFPPPSAPDETLDVPANSEDSRYASPYRDYPPPDLRQLQTLIMESPDSLSILMDDSPWRCLVQGLTPQELGDLCYAAPESRAVSVACGLATGMQPQFQYRHLLACLWALPLEDQRCDVLLRAGPLVNDLEENEEAIERDLSPRELAAVHTALPR